MAIKVSLRQKKISKGRKSLYLDFYPPIPHPETSEPTRRQFLSFYIFEPIKFSRRKNSKGEVIEKPIYSDDTSIHQSHLQHNEDTLKKAESIRTKKDKALNENSDLSELEKRLIEKDKAERELGEQCFIKYFTKLANKRKASNHDNWVSALKYLDTFADGSIKFGDLNLKFLEDFKEYLLEAKSNRSNKTTLSQNTAASYFNKVKAALKQAYKDGNLQHDLNSKIDCIDTIDIIKDTLTLEELNTIVKTDFSNTLCKKIAMFSALTGLPFIEMENLIWGNIDSSETFGIRIKMIRQKTKKAYYVNIGDQAYSLLGDRKEYNEKVFEGLKDKDRYQDFQLLLAKAGIQKQMTFHDLRHTYGVIQIDYETDLYTLQGNMGHSSPRQTMKYGKISDRKKREAANNVKLDM
jgi:integrase